MKKINRIGLKLSSILFGIILLISWQITPAVVLSSNLQTPKKQINQGSVNILFSDTIVVENGTVSITHFHWNVSLAAKFSSLKLTINGIDIPLTGGLKYDAPDNNGVTKGLMDLGLTHTAELKEGKYYIQLKGECRGASKSTFSFKLKEIGFANLVKVKNLSSVFSPEYEFK